jgi:hypothetical protein
MPVKTKSDLERFHDRFTQILEIAGPSRTNRLTNLMNDLEDVYEIPGFNNETFNICNPRIMDLYRAAYHAKNFE